MMKISIEAFLASLKQIRQYVDNLEEKNSILDEAYDLTSAPEDIKNRIAALQSIRTSEKQFAYTVIIITLYGQYETFVERIIKEYLKEMQSGGYNFSQLPPKIQENYFAKVVGLNTKLEWGKYKHLDNKVIAKSLYETLNLDIHSVLPEAYYKNGGNYKINILAECLGDIGMENLKRKLCRYPELQEYYQKKFGLDVNVNEKDDKVLYGIIDEVVEIRNKIAHTGEVDEIRDNTYIKEMFYFFEQFAMSLNSLMQDTLFEVKWNVNTSMAFKPQKVFKHKNVAGFKDVDFEVHNGQLCLCRYPKGNFPQFAEARINDIQEKGVSFTKYHLYENNPFGVGVQMDISVTDGCSFKWL